MRRITLILVGLLVIVGAAWATVTWVGAEGSLWAWSPTRGELRIPERGLVVLPRWRYDRLPGGSLAVTIRAASREGVAVTAHLEVVAPGLALRLAPAPSPTDGLASASESVVRRAVEGMSLACLAGAAGPAENCPADPARDVASALAATLGVAPEALEVTLTPDSEAVRRTVLDRIRAGLPGGGSKVLVIGLDAADWTLMLPLVRQGLMPNLGRLLQAGTWGQMETIVPMLSPLIWTTMATGVSPDQHGILDFVEKDPVSGQVLPVTGRQRRVPAIWNLASALGKTTDVVGWWATWPAERIDGTMVSDRLYFTLTQGIPKESLRMDPPGMVSPADRTARFVALRERAQRETDWTTMRSFLDVPEAAYRSAVSADRGWGDPIDGTRRVVAATRTYFEAALALARPQPDLLMVYIEGTDEIGHILAPYEPPPQVDVDPRTAASYVAAVPRYFAAVDGWIGKLIAACPLSRTTVIVVSDHGFKWFKDRPEHLSGTSGPTAPLWHADRAIYLVAGAGVPALGRQSLRSSVYDVTPTIAALLRLPADTHWSGRPLPGVAASRLRPVDYGPLVPPESYRSGAGTASPVDREYIAKLQSLGYLSGGTTAGTPRPAGGAPSPAVRASAPPSSSLASGNEVETGERPAPTRGELNNLAVIKINEKEYAEAEKLLRQALALSPGYAAPHYNLRRIYMETGRYDAADRELWAAVDRGLRDSPGTLDRAASTYEQLGHEDRAKDLLAKGIKRFPDYEALWVHELAVKLKLGECSEAMTLGRTAASRFPASPAVQAFWGLCAACAGDVATARRALARSLDLKPDQPRLRQALKQLGPS
jgi:Tfp pilus assembly protein PilF